MGTSILQTKLFIPHASKAELVVRSRLVAQLEQGLDHKLILVSAPAGFGKTTLISEWLGQIEYSATWLTLAERDNDPVRFFSYLTAALQRINPAIGESINQLLATPQSPPIDTLMTLLVNDIASAAQEFILVLDDYERIHDSTIHAALAFLLEHQPPQLHLVINTRSDPPLPLARLRARRELTELRVADLRFTRQEASDFFHQTLTTPCEADDIDTLMTRTEGWAAGLQLAALSLMNLHVPAAMAEFVAEFAGNDQYIADYLVEEVLNQVSPDVHDFLLQTAFLERMTGPLCNAVTGRGDGQQRLETLLKTNLFIVALDHRREWFRYHHLFADLLQHRLQQTYPQRIPELHRRASLWYAEAGLIDEAIDHALRGQDLARAGHLVDEASAKALWQQGQVATVMAWLQALPDEQIRATPSLALAQAWCFVLVGKWQQAESYANNVAVIQQETTQQDELVLAEIHALRAILADHHWQAETIQYAHLALASLSEEQVMLRGLVTWVMGIAYFRQGDTEAAHRLFTQAQTSAQKSQNIVASLLTAGGLMLTETRQGRFRRAGELYAEALALATAPQYQSLSSMALASVYMGEVLLEWNELDEAEALLSAGVAQCEQQMGLLEVLLEGKLRLARLKQIQGDYDAAYRLIQDARDLGDTHHVYPMLLRWLQIWKVRFDLAADGQSEATVWLNSWLQSQGDNEYMTSTPTYFLEIEQLTAARVYRAHEQAAQAFALLEAAHTTAFAAGRKRIATESLVLQASILWTQGKNDKALTVLAGALALAKDENYVRTFIDEGKPMMAVLREAANQGIHAPYARKLTAASVDNADASQAQQMLLEPLSERELEVLHLVAVGYSNRQIADELIISVGTVKKHTSNIFGKLGVSKRTQAVARAQELDLL